MGVHKCKQSWYSLFSKKGVVWAKVDRQKQVLGAELLLPHREWQPPNSPILPPCCFPGGAGFTGQAKWPAGQKSGHLVQAPVHQDHPSSDEEVLERPGSWVRFWCWTPLTGLLSITTLCPVLTPNTLPGELLWLWVEPLSHQAGCHYCTHWQQSPAAALPALSLLPSHFYLWKVKFASTESTGLDGKQG